MIVKGISLIVKCVRNINYSAIIFTEVEVFNFLIKKTLFNTANAVSFKYAMTGDVKTFFLKINYFDLIKYLAFNT